jgi:hypothetical protein
MNRKLVVTMTVVAAIVLSAGAVKAASGAFDSLVVGRQGAGGVTYFNGSIQNSTTTNGVDNPVAFADNVRIDGRVYRGATAGTGDTQPFIVNDNMEVAGTLTVGGSPATTKTVITGTIDLTQPGDATYVLDYETDCVAFPDNLKTYTYHYKKVPVSQVSMDAPPDLRVFVSVESDTNGFYPDVADLWTSYGYTIQDGYVYIEYKYTADMCDGTSTGYNYTTGNYKIVLVD